METKICVRCHGPLTDHPAITRRPADVIVEICPECGREEALVDFAKTHNTEIPYSIARRELDFVAFLKWREGCPTN